VQKELMMDEEQYVEELLAWDSGRRSLESLLCYAALLVGGVVLIGVLLFTLIRLEDRVIYVFMIPGVVFGLFFIALYVMGGARIRERHRMADIVRKLKGGR